MILYYIIYWLIDWLIDWWIVKLFKNIVFKSNWCIFWCARKFEPQDFDTLGSLDPTGSRDSGTNKKRQTDYFLTEKSYCWPIIAKNIIINII